MHQTSGSGEADAVTLLACGKPERKGDVGLTGIFRESTASFAARFIIFAFLSPIPVILGVVSENGK